MIPFIIKDGKSHRQPQLITIRTTETRDKENISINKLNYKQIIKRINKIVT
jgi:hypothetical protein